MDSHRFGRSTGLPEYGLFWDPGICVSCQGVQQGGMFSGLSRSTIQGLHGSWIGGLQISRLRVR
eukprot:10093635-Alexandrium_andersonii.AAC.1